jgi:hypothetical protein
MRNPTTRERVQPSAAPPLYPIAASAVVGIRTAVKAPDIAVGVGRVVVKAVVVVGVVVDGVKVVGTVAVGVVIDRAIVGAVVVVDARIVPVGVTLIVTAVRQLPLQVFDFLLLDDVLLHQLVQHLLLVQAVEVIVLRHVNASLFQKVRQERADGHAAQEATYAEPAWRRPVLRAVLGSVLRTVWLLRRHVVIATIPIATATPPNQKEDEQHDNDGQQKYRQHSHTPASCKFRHYLDISVTNYNSH